MSDFGASYINIAEDAWVVENADVISGVIHLNPDSKATTTVKNLPYTPVSLKVSFYADTPDPDPLKPSTYLTFTVTYKNGLSDSYTMGLNNSSSSVLGVGNEIVVPIRDTVIDSIECTVHSTTTVKIPEILMEPSYTISDAVRSSIDSGGNGLLYFMNGLSVPLDTDWSYALSEDIQTSEATNLSGSFIASFTLSSVCRVQARVTLNGIVLPIFPVFLLCSDPGEHFISFPFTFIAIPVGTNSVSIELKLSAGTGSINSSKCETVIQGSGILGSTPVTPPGADVLEVIDISGLASSMVFTDSVSSNIYPVILVNNLSETIDISTALSTFTATDSVAVSTETEV